MDIGGFDYLDVVTTVEAAERLGVQARTIVKWCKTKPGVGRRNPGHRGHFRVFRAWLEAEEARRGNSRKEAA